MFKKQTYQNDSRILNKVVENMDNMLQNIEDRVFSFYISIWSIFPAVEVRIMRWRCRNE